MNEGRITGSSLLIVIPARGGSKRIPRKNVRLLGGRPLLDYTATAVADAELNAPVLLSTEDGEIAARGRDLGLSVIDRPPDLAGDRVSTAPVITHSLQVWTDLGHEEPDLLMLLQPTSPFRGPDILRGAVEMMADRPDADAVVGVTALHVGLGHVFTRDPEGVMSPVGTGPERVLVPNGAVFLIRTAAFRRYVSFYPPNTIGLEMDGSSSLDIDTEDDWRLAEAMIEANAADVKAGA